MPFKRICGGLRSVFHQKKPAGEISASPLNYLKHSCATEKNKDLCAIQELISQAHAAGALLVVTSEYGLGQSYYEPVPVLGVNPATDSNWGDDLFIKILSKQAAALKIYLVINLQTVISVTGGKKYHNSQVAFGPDGTVVGVHHKFELFASEAKDLTPGQDVSVFDTPLGKVGMLTCADLYGDLRLHDKLTRTLGAKVIAVSSLWTANGSVNWPRNYAKNWGVHVLFSNTTNGTGRGGGIFDPKGEALDLRQDMTPGITYASITVP